jgi:murein DD-endopeptidase MepM/ murein hydrolase activator NlpD
LLLRKNSLVIILVILSFFQLLYSNSVKSEIFYPRILSLDSRKDEIFKQFEFDVVESKKLLAANQNPTMMFYRYKTTSQDTLFSISARCNILIETIATLNHISSTTEDISNKEILLPIVDGIFVTNNPTSPFEEILKKNCFKYDNTLCYNLKVGEEIFLFFPGMRVGSTERYFFLDSSLKMPLRESVLTSDFGMRVSPITGKNKFHSGVDLASPEGTSVFACGHGVVKKTGWDNVYGYYVIVEHSSNRSSFYAHLSKIVAQKGEKVSSKSCIGKVGSTGASTGPHLHFEIRKNNSKVNPFSEISN